MLVAQKIVEFDFVTSFGVEVNFVEFNFVEFDYQQRWILFRCQCGWDFIAHWQSQRNDSSKHGKKQCIHSVMNSENRYRLHLHLSFD